MNTFAKPGLSESASRNQAINPSRVQEMQNFLQRLQERGLFRPPKYSLNPGLAAAPQGTQTTHNQQSMEIASRVSSELQLDG